MRLIFAEAFQKFLLEHLPPSMSEEAAEAYMDVMQMLEDERATPTIEAEPVKHGKWLGERGSYICSVCGCEGPEDGGYWASPYCPCCGAKMDLEKSNENNND